MVEVFTLNQTNLKGLRTLTDLFNIAKQWALYTNEPSPSLEEAVSFYRGCDARFLDELKLRLDKTLKNY